LQSVLASPVLERAASSPVSRPVPSLAVAQPVSSLAMGEPGESAAVPQPVPLSPVLERTARPPDTVSERPNAGEVVLDYWTAVRGILNDDQGGPLHPCGVRMAAALGDVRQSLERSLAAEKGARTRTTTTVRLAVLASKQSCRAYSRRWVSFSAATASGDCGSPACD